MIRHRGSRESFQSPSPLWESSCLQISPVPPMTARINETSALERNTEETQKNRAALRIQVQAARPREMLGETKAFSQRRKESISNRRVNSSIGSASSKQNTVQS